MTYFKIGHNSSLTTNLMHATISLILRLFIRFITLYTIRERNALSSFLPFITLISYTHKSNVFFLLLNTILLFSNPYVQSNTNSSLQFFHSPLLKECFHRIKFISKQIGSIHLALSIPFFIKTKLHRIVYWLNYYFEG